MVPHIEDPRINTRTLALPARESSRHKPTPLWIVNTYDRLCPPPLITCMKKKKRRLQSTTNTSIRAIEIKNKPQEDPEKMTPAMTP